MARTVLLVTALALGAASCAMLHSSKTAKLPEMTCEEFLGLSEDVRPRAVAWLDGYSKGGKLKEQDIGEIDVDRQMAALVVVCEQDPKQSFWDKIRGHLPGGSRKVKPAKLTCQEFVALDQTVRPEVVYWAEGYNRAAKVQQGTVGEVDLERDVAVIVEECKQAPTESFWAKMKTHL